MADTEVEILKTLEGIENLLRGASVLSRTRPMQLRNQGNQRDRDLKNKFKAVASNSDKLNNTVVGLNKSLSGLNDAVNLTSTGFGSLQTKMAKFTSSLEPVQIPEAKEQVKPVSTEALQKELAGVTDVLRGFGTSLTALQARLSSVNPQELQSAAKQVASPLENLAASVARTSKEMPSVNDQAKNLVDQLQNLGRQTRNSGTAVSKLAIPWQMVMGRMLGTVTVGAGAAGAALNAFGGVAKRLIVDFFSLSKVGVGSYSNLFELSKSALTAGMSLKEYTDMLKENITFASRAGSLENFDKITSAANSQLAALGIFGDDAKKLQASLADASTQMGVSQSNLASTISGQISVFDQLRKTTLMTADEFANLVKSIANNEDAQKELVGLSGASRLARQQELLSISSTGAKLGLAADQSAKLADALLNQRKQTVKDRFDQAGRVRQLSAFAGMGAEGERAAQIIMKGRRASADEIEELRQIAGSLDERTQNIYETNGLGAQNVVDQLSETLGNVKSIMDANRPAQLAQESGKAFNKDFGQHVDKFGQGVGQLIAWGSGFRESIMPTLLTGIGATLLAVFKGPISGMLKSVASKVTGLSVSGEAAAVAEGAAGSGGALASLKGALTSLGSPIKAISSYITDTVALFNSTKNTWGTFVGAIAVLQKGVSGIFSFGVSIIDGLHGFLAAAAPIAAGIDAVMEAITGKLSSAMDPDGGIWARIVGVATAALTAVPKMIIDGLTFIFGDSFMKPIQSVFDVVKVGIAGAINGLARIALGAVSYLTDLLPKDSGLRKMVDAAKASLDTSLQNNAEAINKLGGLFGSENRKTLEEVGKANEKAADDSEKKSKVATTKALEASKAFNNVQYGVFADRNSVVQDANAVLGTPQVQTVQQVTPAEVNTKEQPQQTSAQPAQVQTTPASDVTQVLQLILKVMQDVLTEEQKQTLLADGMLNKLRPVATFDSAEGTARKLLRGPLL